MLTFNISLLIIMKRFFNFISIAAVAVAMVSCAGANQMKVVDNIKVDCTPEILATLGETNIPADITVTYPKNYFSPKAILTVTPVLVYEGGEQEAAPFVYQGEKVKDNYKVVSMDGGTVKEHTNFTYEKGMEVSHLELRGKVTYGAKVIDVPAIKVADGVNTTSRLAKKSGEYGFKADEYQEIIHETAEGQILYDVNSAVVKKNQLRSESIAALQEALKEISENERYTVKGTKVIAYASPEGGQKLNSKLSDKRAGTAQDAWKKISKGTKNNSTVEIQSIGQDWEGFQEAVSKSNISDKDLILRVLSMYSDPAVREQEIRNMSQVYTEINKKVFPDLRRARFVTEADYKNFTDEELEELAQKAIGTLDEEGLLRVATNSKSMDRKAALYKRAADVFGSDKGNFNLGVIALNNGKDAEAASYFAKVKKVDDDVLNAKGVCELRKGNLDEAAKYFSKASSKEAKANLGTVKLLKGDYAGAVKDLAGTGSCNEALGYILNGQNDKAASAIDGECPRCSYLKAIVAARKGDKNGVKNALSAASKNDGFKARAAKDIEFANFR